jgi:hypothetical protein
VYGGFVDPILNGSTVELPRIVDTEFLEGNQALETKQLDELELFAMQDHVGGFHWHYRVRSRQPEVWNGKLAT